MLYSIVFSLLFTSLANVDLQNMLQSSEASKSHEDKLSSVGDDAQLAMVDL